MLIRLDNLSAELMLRGQSNIQDLRLMFIFVDQFVAADAWLDSRLAILKLSMMLDILPC